MIERNVNLILGSRKGTRYSGYHNPRTDADINVKNGEKGT